VERGDYQISIANNGNQKMSDKARLIMVVGITWTQILDPGRRTLDFASLDCTACIQSRLQAMAWW
jgi:hypothetical protein